MAANERLRSTLINSTYSVQDLADQLGVDPKTAERWVTKGRIPHRQTASRAARLLGVSASWLWPVRGIVSQPFGPSAFPAEYPPLAKMARIQGTVRLEAIISKDGTIQDLKVIQGHPLLVKAALEAVQRWRYQPTLLNGEPVEVVTEIDVNYTLAE